MGTMRGELDTGNDNLLTFQGRIFTFQLTILRLSVIVLEYLGRGPDLAPPAATVRLQTHNPESFTRFYHSSKSYSRQKCIMNVYHLPPNLT